MAIPKSTSTRVPLSRRSVDAVGGKPSSAVPDTSQFLVACVTLGIALVAFIVPLATIPMSQFAFGSLLIFSVTLAFLLCVMTFQAATRPRPRTVRFVTGAGLTWFSRSRALLLVLMAGTALCAAAVAGFSIFIVARGLLVNGGGLLGAAPWLAWMMSIAGAVFAFVSCREVPRVRSTHHGVRLSPDGISMNVAGRDVPLRWDQIVRVRSDTVTRPAGKKSREVPCVTITGVDGRTFTVEALDLGSDATVVAAFIFHHRDRPAERAWLAEPKEAVRRFSEAQTETSK